MGNNIHLDVNEGFRRIRKLESLQSFHTSTPREAKEENELMVVGNCMVIWTFRNNIMFKGAFSILDYHVSNIKVVSWLWHAVGNKSRICANVYWERVL